jgi:hypothetical protein
MVASASPVPNSRGAAALLGGMGFGLLGWVALGAVRRTDRKRWTWIATLVAVALMLAATGCGGSGTTPLPSPKATPISVTVTSQGGGLSQRLNLTLKVQP